IFRDPRWGRGHETYGEDPYLTTRLGLAYIRGLQGEGEHLKSAACAKHFAVHSGPENERHSFNAVVDKYDLWNTYLAAFEAAVKEGKVEAVMGAYNRTNGEPCCGSKFLLTDVLRKKWKFDGHVVSDCWAIKDFHEHHRVTNSPVESVVMAIKAGCDLNCGVLFPLAYDAVQHGVLEEALIDQAVTRLIVTRLRLGILGDEDKTWAALDYEAVDCAAHRALNLEAARRGVIMLKNDGSLPLNAAKLSSVAVIGPNADNRRSLDGNYQGTPAERVTVLEGVREIAEKAGCRVYYSEGCPIQGDRCQSLAQADDRFAEARAIAKIADAVIVVLGLDGSIEGEEGDAFSESQAGDKPGIELPGRQEALLKEVRAAAGHGKPVVLVTISGSCIVSAWAEELVSGIFQAFYGGAYGGRAAAEAVFGKLNPSGKLPLTFYRDTSALPAFTDYSMEGRTYRYFKGPVLYPFGFGLSYSRFELSDLTATRRAVSVKVKNAGPYDGREVVQVYVETPGTKEIRSLCGMGTVFLKAGKERALRIALNKNAFGRYNENGTMMTIKGTHRLAVGFHQGDAESVRRAGTTPLYAELVL
ncbi:MAG: glycoside hydrolase family 3 C-terminal domain-containing protein, partial [Spirochaetaceae bacterium]|nr:glycoside hydrolase family 3 C-terminal domain-containing protein [Spirochaetaceae bacterium]